jgi:hypothetical protein
MIVAHVDAYPSERSTFSLDIFRVSRWQQFISNMGKVAGITTCDGCVPTRIRYRRCRWSTLTLIIRGFDLLLPKKTAQDITNMQLQ